MAHLTTPSIARQLGTLFDGGSAAGLSDRQLIERFNHRRDDAAAEAAFAALVPQGLHRQAGRDPRPRRHRHREAAEMTHPP